MDLNSNSGSNGEGKRWSVLGYSVGLFALVAILLTSITLVAWKILRSEHISLISRAETRKLSTNVGEINGKLDGILADLHYLENSRELIEFLDEPTPEHTHSAGEELEDVFKAKGSYNQARFIDNTGMEVVRVSIVDGQPTITPTDRLQDKSNRYYFQIAIKHEPGEIYFSRVDLNVEHGEIEIPFKPVIRVATPLADNGGTKRGLLVLNYMAEGILAPLREASEQSTYLMINDEGYYLLNDDPSKEWAFMFPSEMQGTKGLFNFDYPSAWEQMVRSPAGTVVTDHGLFVFNTIRPHEIVGTWINPQSVGEENLGMQASQWKLVSYIPNGKLDLTFAGTSRIVLTGYSILMLGSLVICLLVSHQMARRRIAEDENRISEARFKRLAELASEGIVIHEAGKIIDCNPAFIEMTGFTQVELIGSSVLDLIVDNERDEMASRFKAKTEGRFEATGVRKDKSTLPVAIGAFHIPYYGRKVRVSTIYDLTAQKELEKFTLQQKELEVIRITAATHAHEINNPLTGIGGVLQVLSQENFDSDSHALIAEALSAVNRIKDVIVQMEKMGTPKHRPYVGGREILDLREGAPDNEVDQ